MAVDGLVEGVGNWPALEDENEEGGEPRGDCEGRSDIYGYVERTTVRVKQAIV